MRQFKFAVALLSAAVLAGCGGGSTGGNQSTKVQFTSQVSFGDSLSDVGTYAVGTVAALGGGKYTVNSAPPSAQNWTQLMAASLGLPVPCPAQTGLDGDALQGFSVMPTTQTGCTSYAQGGARVTNPVGPGNKDFDASGAVLGQLTVPIVTQIANYLASPAAVGGKFSGTEVVFVLAGANDVFAQLHNLSVDATAAGGNAYVATLVGTLAAGSTVPATAAPLIQAALVGNLTGGGTIETATVAAYTAAIGQGFPPGSVAAAVETATAAGTAAGTAFAADPANLAVYVTAMATAGGELAGYVNTQILANGAKYVTVINIPDMGTTPFANAQSASTVSLINAMVSAFNSQLQAGLASSNALFVDANTQSHLNTQNPGQYALTNVTTPACNLDSSVNPLSSSLACNAATNVIAGDVSHYLFADTVHPTPYGYSLLAKYVATQMALRGWM